MVLSKESASIMGSIRASDECNGLDSFEIRID